MSTASTRAQFAAWLRRSTSWPVLGRLVPGLLAALVLLGALTVLVGRSMSKPSELDQRVATWFAGHRAGWLTPIMRTITTLGSPTGVAITATVVVGALCWRSRRVGPGLLAVVVLGGAELLQTITKVLAARPRPPMSLWVAGMSPTGLSFPSGHALLAAAGYGLMAVLLTRHLRRLVTRTAVWVAAVAAATLVGVSRLYLGVHWFSDVIAGWLIGALWLSLVLAAVTWGSGGAAARSARRPPTGDEGADSSVDCAVRIGRPVVHDRSAEDDVLYGAIGTADRNPEHADREDDAGYRPQQGDEKVQLLAVVVDDAQSQQRIPVGSPGRVPAERQVRRGHDESDQRDAPAQIPGKVERGRMQQEQEPSHDRVDRRDYADDHEHIDNVRDRAGDDASPATLIRARRERGRDRSD